MSRKDRNLAAASVELKPNDLRDIDNASSNIRVEGARYAREAQGNARAGTPAEAAKDADALLLAVHWSRIDDVLKQAGDLAGKVVVTCSLPMDAGNTKLIIANTSSGAEELAKKVPKARGVSAFNTVPSEEAMFLSPSIRWRAI